MTLYSQLSDLNLVVGGYDLSIRERETTSEFTRTTTVIRLDGTGKSGREEYSEDESNDGKSGYGGSGDGETGYGGSGYGESTAGESGAGGPKTGASGTDGSGTGGSGTGESGYGEDVTYERDHHYTWLEAEKLPLAGEYTIDGFSRHLDDIDLFPGDGPEREVYRHYRRWALESAALDLALKQADETLASALGREYDTVRFVVSTRLGDPPTFDRIERLLSTNPDLSFKLDPTADWSEELVSRLVETESVRILDLKGHYEDTEVDQGADRDLYETVIEEFPDALLEDPALTDETRPLFDGRERRVSWDAPITSVERIETLPWEPRWLNVKPSRFGSLQSVLDAIEYCLENDIRMYGGGQFELAVGRQHLQALASVFYPDAPNDIAPGGYNLPDLPADLPTSPLKPPEDPAGLEWDSPDIPMRDP